MNKQFCNLRFLLLLIFSFFILDSFCQKGYITGKNFKRSGIELKNGGKKENAKYIIVDYKNNVVTYTPSTIQGYGFVKGKKYVSDAILLEGEMDSVFLEVLVTGKTNLYYFPLEHGKVFYLQKDSGILVPLKKKNNSNKTDYKEELTKNTDPCPGSDRLVHAANFTKGYMTSFVESVNNGCDKKYIPFIKYGLLVNYGWATLKVPQENVLLNRLEFDPETRFGFGGFINFPLWPSNFSSYSEIYVENNSFSSEQTDNSELISIDIDYASLNIPLMIRYTVPSRYLRPFLNAGMMYTWNYSVIKAELVKPETAWNVEENIYATRQYNLLAGCGLEIPVTTCNVVTIDCRYSWGVITQRSKFFRDEFNISCGFNF